MITFRAKNGSTQSMSLRLADMTKALAEGRV